MAFSVTAFAEIDKEPCSPTYGQEIPDEVVVQNYACDVRTVNSQADGITDNYINFTDVASKNKNSHKIMLDLTNVIYDDRPVDNYALNDSKYGFQDILLNASEKVPAKIELFAKPMTVKSSKESGEKEVKITKRATLIPSLKRKGEATLTIDFLRIEAGSHTWSVMSEASYEVFCAQVKK